MADDATIELTTAELATIEFRPGDTAVLMFPGKLSMEMIQRIRETFESIRPGIKCLVLDDGARLGVIREVPE
jgi:hypothetical protein